MRIVGIQCEVREVVKCKECMRVSGALLQREPEKCWYSVIFVSSSIA